MGLILGEVTPTSALLQLRLARVDHPIDGDMPGRPGLVEFILSPILDGKSASDEPAPTPRIVVVTGMNCAKFHGDILFVAALPRYVMSRQFPHHRTTVTL